ncbi:MAG: recombinase family protein [Caulobacteraceae bacterium]|nr:recombinase family protein [Caulobacteraceae bacterium]
MTKTEAEGGLLVGYARVSTQDQKLEAQIEALKRAGVDPDHIHTDHASGVSRRRPGLALLMKDVREGDTVVVVSLDRFGRSISDLLKRLEELDRRGVRFKTLTQPIDTGLAIGRLLLHVLGAVAEFERALIAERTKRGMQHRKANGAKFGRDFVLTPPQVKEMRALRKQGIRPSDLAKQFGVSRGTVYNSLRRKPRKI